MDKLTFYRILKALIPTPIFYFMALILPQFLLRYRNVPEAVDVIGGCLYGLMAIGFVFSIYQAWKLQGKVRWLLIAAVLLLLPVQFICSIALQVGIFGK